ncbi:MAG: DUF1275 domain-containing protein [Erysipelotrichaceae bacterium]|nr:DUF1275 domain-containing protein [Erysipelotrichaceae bacterium]
MNFKDYFHEDEEKEQSLHMGMLLSFAIGILNACTYVTRGHVFASSQSGNLLYMGLDLAAGDFSKFPKYIFCIVMFGTGVFLAERFHSKYRQYGWRKISTILEICLIAFATFLPDSLNMIANPLFGLVCGLQSITFRVFHQISLPTININGNIQNAIQYASRYIHTEDQDSLQRASLYTTMIATYLAGIILGAVLAKPMGHYVSMVSIACLILALILMIPDSKTEH